VPVAEGTAEVIGTFARTAVALVVLPIAIFCHSLAAIGLALVGAPAARIHRVYLSVARICLLLGGTELRVRGVEKIERGQAYVVVSNHDSGWDPVCLLAGLPDLVLRFIAKRQFMDIPVLGQALRLTGNVRVVRTETTSDAARIHRAMDRRDPEVSILFFAEGRRSRDGAFHPFKMGAFVTALGYGLPIVPIGIAGTRSIWERSVVRLRKGSVAIQVGEPIPVEGLTVEDRQVLRDRSFDAVRTLRTRARQRLREAGGDPGGTD
jgi:1-acyl-sn-glycerol-3-phosphate acyltransferase